jgi:hypothetical protein
VLGARVPSTSPRVLLLTISPNDLQPSREPQKPCVVQYLYVHGPDEQFNYPTSRARGTAAIAARYMECALVQSGSLCLREADCDVVFVTNLRDRKSLGRQVARLLQAIESLGVEIVFADYRHRPLNPIAQFMSSQYVFDAIAAVGDLSDPDRRLWLMDVDCVWLNPRKAFAAAPAPPSIGCIQIPYPPDWDITGFTPTAIEEIASRLAGSSERVGWVGGELLTGSVRDLCELVATCKALEAEIGALGYALNTEEHLLSLAGALGRVQFCDLSAVARRVLTGPRHEAPPVEDPGTLGVWHLPTEKGLGFRRGARAILAGKGSRLTRDLDVPSRALKRFNIEGAGLSRRVRDDAWIAGQRVREGIVSRVRAS